MRSRLLELLTMKRGGSLTRFAGAALAIGTAAGLILLEDPAPQAQPQTAPAAGTIPTSDVPFYAAWTGSPHARRSAEAFNHWNTDGMIPVRCAKCHSTPGFRDFLGADGSTPGVVDRPAPIGTVITCVACHNDKTRTLTSVTFPSGLTVENLGGDAVCMTCHQGAESTMSVTRLMAGLDDDKVEPKLEFLNVHYRAAGAMLMGTLAKVGYEYPEKTYAGRFQHRKPYNRCTTCHELHTVDVKVADCAICHRGTTDRASLHRIRMSLADYDGNGDTSEGIAQQIDNLRSRLLAAIMAYGRTIAGKPIVYDFDEFPYFFVDTNDNGVADKDEIVVRNRYNAWTPRLMKAAFNYQFVIKDPGAYAHNSIYAIQLLHDSLADLGTKVPIDLARATRP
jgi:Cytochrome c7 and related cytochrome c